MIILIYLKTNFWIDPNWRIDFVIIFEFHQKTEKLYNFDFIKMLSRGHLNYLQLIYRNDGESIVRYHHKSSPEGQFRN